MFLRLRLLQSLVSAHWVGLHSGKVYLGACFVFVSSLHETLSWHNYEIISPFCLHFFFNEVIAHRPQDIW